MPNKDKPQEKSLLRLQARKLLASTPGELKQNLKGKFILVFDDGELEVTAAETVFTSYCWDFHKKYPKIPLLKAHHVTSVLKGKLLGMSTHIKLMEAIIFNAIDVYEPDLTWLELQTLKNKLFLQMYEVTNTLYNVYATEYFEEFHSVDLLDFYEITNQPKIREILMNMTEDEGSLKRAYFAVDSAIKGSAEYPEVYNNILAVLSRTGLVKHNQLLQCLAGRGSLADINNDIFKKPVIRSFSRGFRELSDALMESRSAAQSLASNQEQLEQAEWFAREIQLVTQCLARVHKGDCGSKHYLNWLMRDAVWAKAKEEGLPDELVRRSDLDIFAGKYYWDDDRQVLRVIRSGDKHLLGKILKIRSYVAGCQSTDPNGVCEACVGDMRYTIDHTANFGQSLTAEFTRIIAQLMLSTKHYLGSASSESVVIKEEFKRFLEPAYSGNGYKFNEGLKDMRPILVLPKEDAAGLADLDKVDSVKDLPVASIAALTLICIKYQERKTDWLTPVFPTVGVGSRKAFLTEAFLSYIKRKGWTYNQEGNYEIDLSEWDFKKPTMKLPMKQATMHDFAENVKCFIKRTKDSKDTMFGQALTKSESDALGLDSSALQAFGYFLDMVNSSRISINAAVAEAVLYPTMVASVARGNYNLPKVGDAYDMPTMAEIVSGRSLSTALVHNAMGVALNDPRSFSPFGRPSLPSDVIITPNEAVNDPLRNTWYYSDDPSITMAEQFKVRKPAADAL